MAKKRLQGLPGYDNIEVEKDEIVETPSGKTAEIKKGSHAKGTGTKISVPVGTEIFSNKVKGEDGRTMKERKEARMERAARRERVLDKITKSEDHYGKHDTPTANARQRKLAILLTEAAADEVEEMEDVMTMQEISESSGKVEKGSEVPEYMFGGVTGDPITWAKTLRGALQSLNAGKEFDPANIGIGDYASTKDLKPPAGSVVEEATPATENTKPGNEVRPPEEGGARGKNFLDLLSTAAPFLGPAGTVVSAVSPLITTLTQRATDRRHRNQMRSVGQREIVENDLTASALAGSRDRQLEANEVTRATAGQNYRISARGQNLLRAMELAGITGKYRADSEVNQRFDDQFANLRRETGQLRTAQELRTAQDDIRVRSEEDADKDAFFTALSTSGQELGRGGQQLARMANADPESRDGVLAMLQDLISLYKK